MRPPASAIEQLKAVDWFHQVGVRSPIETQLRLEYVPSWKRALTLRGRVSAANAFQEGAGMLTRELGRSFRRDYRNWNDFADEAREILESDLCPRVDALIDANPKIFGVESGSHIAKCSVRWDAIHYVMEQVYSDLVPPRFYAEIFAIYRAGHFPCHWDEAWPNGRLWIY